MDKTAVVILHYQNVGDTLACLDSLYQEGNKMRNWFVIIVDNSSSSGFSKELKKKYGQLDVIGNKKNLGFSIGNNLGIKKALSENCSAVILLNNDTIVSAGMVNALIRYGKSNRHIGLISPKIYFASGYEYHRQRYSIQDRGKVLWYAGGVIDWNNMYALHKGVDEVDTGQYNSITDTDFATGCCLFIKKEVFEKIGYFNEKYFLYYEDVDLSIRAKKAGFRVVYYPKTFLWHKNAASSGGPGSDSHVYYQTRNRLYLGMRYAPIGTKKSLIVESFKGLFKNPTVKQAVLAYYRGKMGEREI